MNDYCVYVAFHRDGELIPGDSMYKALQVGKANSRLELNMLHDAAGNNISEKNNIYSELTGWYWIWKNTGHLYVGTSHYRRYFTVEKASFFRQSGKMLLFFAGLKKKRHGLFYVNSAGKWKNRILTSGQTQELMQQYDAILPVKKQFRYSVYEQYKRRHNEKDILLAREIIGEKHPDYLPAFDEAFASKQMYSFNMFILPWKLFDEYMNWLFPVLFELEKRATIGLNDKYQKRVCAFMAERLQTVWFTKNKLRVKELNVLYFKKMKTTHF